MCARDQVVFTVTVSCRVLGVLTPGVLPVAR